MVSRFGKVVARWPVEKAIYVACAIGLIALVMMALGIITTSPLLLIASMSVSQGLGVLAGLIFAISIAAEAVRPRP